MYLRSEACGPVHTRWERNLEVLLVSVDEGKPETPTKDPQRKDEKQQQTQSRYDVRCGSRKWVTLVGGECSHHFNVPCKITT